MIVVDTNVVVYLLSGRGPRSERAADLLRRDPLWAAPPILLSELRNVLVGSVQRGLVDTTDALAMHDDAEFAVLARTLDIPLVTEDREILAAAQDVGLGLSDGEDPET